MAKTAVQILKELGFTELEADIYVFLLGQPAAATGYRIAQGIGKAAANTYQAIETLRKKGAVIAAEGESRACRAVPMTELLNRLESDFMKRRAEATRLLADLGGTSNDLGVYRLRSREQILERARSMLLRCREVAICTVFPQPLSALRPEIEAAARRGVMIAVTAYEPTEIPGVDIVIDPGREKVLRRWPGQWLNIVIDGTEHLLALLGTDDNAVHEATWTANPYLSWVYHSAVSTALITTVLARQIQDGASIEQLRRSLGHYRRYQACAAAGYQALIQQHFGGTSHPASTAGRKHSA
jgi:sugar-specific transcriptional regulator TrmB